MCLELCQGWTSQYFSMKIPLGLLISFRGFKSKVDLSSHLLEWAPHKMPRRAMVTVVTKQCTAGVPVGQSPGVAQHS